jgi:glycosyltransferase involved in cell wall biosynthesis
VKLAVVVQRYGEAINGGAELHARYVAEHLARHAEVEVITTCAADYVTWRNELPAGTEQINGVTVRRCRVKQERDTVAFSRLSDRVFNQRHSLADELAWLDAEGPTSPALIDHLERHGGGYDFCIFFSYRYYHAYHGARAAGAHAILVPTAERDLAVGLAIFRPIFRGVRALMYNSPEERAMIQSVSGNEDVPSVIVGIGSSVPSDPQPGRFRQTFNVREPFAIYVGRIDANKGCRELFEFFTSYVQAGAGRLTLVLVGNSLLPVPNHPRIRHLGFLNEADKFDAMAAADLLIMPSYFESLSMVTLEAWALGRPVLANARCDVLKGQCIRSNAGLYYDNELEFVEALQALEHNQWLGNTLGRNGRRYFREHYDWPVIERKYLDVIDRLSKGTDQPGIEPLPGWFARRTPDCPAASDVVAALPAGPSLVEAQADGNSGSREPVPDEPPAPAGRERSSPDRRRSWRRSRSQRGSSSQRTGSRS